MHENKRILRVTVCVIDRVNNVSDEKLRTVRENFWVFVRKKYTYWRGPNFTKSFDVDIINGWGAFSFGISKNDSTASGDILCPEFSLEINRNRFDFNNIYLLNRLFGDISNFFLRTFFFFFFGKYTPNSTTRYIVFYFSIRNTGTYYFHTIFYNVIIYKRRIRQYIFVNYNILKLTKHINTLKTNYIRFDT